MEQWTAIVEALPTLVRFLMGIAIGLAVPCEIKYLFFHRTTKKEN